MTREEKKIIREQKKTDNIAAKLQIKVEKLQDRQWNDFIKRMESKQALITEN